MATTPTLEPGPGGLLIYRNALLIVTVLGGVKLEGLDRMRVTLKVEVPLDRRRVSDDSGPLKPAQRSAVFGDPAP